MSHGPYTQHERILQLLRQAGATGVCGRTFLQAYLPTYSQRIGELKRQGYEITSERCTAHPHGRSHLARYTLVEEPPDDHVAVGLP